MDLNIIAVQATPSDLVTYTTSKYQITAGQNTVRPDELVNSYFFGGSNNPSNSNGFYATATLHDESVTVSGDNRYGGDASSVYDFISSDVTLLAVVAEGGFVAVKNDGNLKSWGNWAAGNVSGSNVVQIAVSMSGWVALKSDGTIISAGAYQIDKPNGSNFVKVFAGGYGGYAALTDKGELLIWGYATGSGLFYDNEFAPSGSLASGIVDVAFDYGSGIALKNDGSTVTWGHPGYRQELIAWDFNAQPTGDVSISGTAQQYQILVASNTLADADGLSAINYQWFSNGLAISNATLSSYSLTQTNVGETISVTASYSDGLGNLESVTSAGVIIRNVNDLPTGFVTISGTATQRQILFASNTLADVDGLGAISYQWFSNNLSLPNASQATYTLTQADVGKIISVTARYTDGLNAVESVSSEATVAVANVNDQPTGTVTISGAAKQAVSLSATNTLADVDGLGTLSYQWLANDTPITGAIGASFTPTQATVGQSLRVIASYTDSFGQVETVSSAATTAVANTNDVPTGTVSIAGELKQDGVLSVSHTLSDSDGLGEVSYQWQSDGRTIGTGAQYTLSQVDVNKTLTVMARYTDGFNTVETVTSPTTLAVANVNDSPTGTVNLSTDSPRLWQALTASNTLADLDGLGAISYTWSRGATVLGTGSQYTPQVTDIGSALTVTARYTDGFGTLESASHISSAAVAPLSAGFILNKDDTITNESGDTAGISIKLTAAPTRDVTISFTSSDTSEGVLLHPVLSFTASNWFTPQAVIAIGQNDYVYDGSQTFVVSAAIESTDVNYRQLAIAPIQMTNLDDVTTKNEGRIPAGVARDMPLKIYGDAIVDYTAIDNTTGLFDTTGTKPVNDVLKGLDGNDTLYGQNLQDDLSGGIGDDELYGENDQDHLYGDSGNDTLFGGSGVDTLEGGTGNDVLNGGDDDLAADLLIGGAGNDTYYLGYGKVDVINDKGLKTDIDTVIMPYQLSSYTLPSGIEQGTMTQGMTANSLLGNASNNLLTGNDGSNILNGAVGNDVLVGGLGEDVLIGGTGNDVLQGGLGKDSLSGGIGRDVFFFNMEINSLPDSIADFKVIDDTIKLDKQIFTHLSSGVLEASQFVKGSTALDSNDYIIYNPSTGAVTYDADGSGVGFGVQIALLGIKLGITAADFVVI